MRCIAVEDLANRAKALVCERITHRLQQRLRRRRVAGHTERRQGEVPEQPAPHRTLMIAAVALPHVASVVCMVVSRTGSKRPQSVRGQQMPTAHIHDHGLSGRFEWCVRQADCKYLVGADALHRRRSGPSITS